VYQYIVRDNRAYARFSTFVNFLNKHYV